MKKPTHFLLIAALFLLLLPTRVYAATGSTPISDGDYIIETVIAGEDSAHPPYAAFAGVQTITRTKTTYIRNASGDVLWYVSITAAFEYNGSSAKCIRCSCDAKSENSSWKIKSYSCSKSGNSATAAAKATHTGALGISQDYTQSVTIQCSAAGEIS